MPRVIDPFAGIDLRAVLAHTATIETPADIEPSCDVIRMARSLQEAAEDMQAMESAITDLGVAAWIGAAHQETADAEAQPQPAKHTRKRRNPAA